MKNWFKELRRKAKIRYLLEKYQHEETQKRMLRPIWPLIEKVRKIGRKLGSTSWTLLKSGGKKLRHFGKVIVWPHIKKACSWGWSMTKKTGRAIRSSFNFLRVKTVRISRILQKTYERRVRPTLKRFWQKRRKTRGWQLLILIAFLYGVILVVPTLFFRRQLTSGFNEIPWEYLGYAILTLLGLSLVAGVIWIAKIAFPKTRLGSEERVEAPSKPATPAPTRTVVTRSVVVNTIGLFWSVVLLAIVGLAVLYRAEVKEYLASRSVSTPRTVAATEPSSTRLPADVVLPIIADCESGSRNTAGLPILGTAKQFDENGAIIQSETSDIGKYQIHLPTHWGRAEQMDIDLYTEEGNEKYARILYEENGTQDWNASRECWERELAKLSNQEELEYTFMAPTDDWSNVQHFPHPTWKKVEYRAVRENGQFVLRNQVRREFRFTPEKSEKVPGILTQAEFKSLSNEPEEIWIRLSK